MTERRKIPRRRILKAGVIAFDPGAAIDCRVRNISDIGALLEIESPVGIPNEFTLIIRSDNVKRSCRVIWRSARRIGIHFT